MSDNLKNSTQNLDTSDDEQQPITCYMMYKPIECPIANCDHVVSASTLLCHLVAEHSTNWGLEGRELFAGRGYVLCFELEKLIRNQNMCLGLLAYGGPKHLVDQPEESKGPVKNAFLPAPYDKWKKNVIIMVMVSRININPIGENNDLMQEDNLDQDSVVIWVTSMPTVCPLYATITVFDKMMSVASSTIIKVRSLDESQNAREFPQQDLNHILLRHSHVKMLSKDGKERIYMEAIVNEYNCLGWASELIWINRTIHIDYEVMDPVVTFTSPVYVE